MRWIRELAVIILLGVLSINVSLRVSAADSINSINEVDTEEFVELIVTERITVPDVAVYLKNLDESQYQEFVRIFTERVGINRAEIQQEAAKYTTILSQDELLSAEAEVILAPGAVWAEVVENTWTWDINGPFSIFWYEDWGCDDDPADKEYVFYYAFPSNPTSELRWTTTSAQVYAAFAVYNWNLLGFGYNFSEVRLCIGDNGVGLAGGPDKVRDTVFVHR